MVRAEDTPDTLKRKVRLATILGTLQSLLTNFQYLRPTWRKNTEEERLLGVSLTGLLDHPTLAKDKALQEELRSYAVEVNAEYATKLGINPSAAITCVKPSGTVSQLVDAASGIHPRWSQFYLRAVRGDNKDPLTQFMIDSGFPYEPDFYKPDSTTVFYFPQKAPDGALVRRDLSAIEHLEIWKTVQESWCEHKPSITVNVKESEWVDVAAWVYENFDALSGVAFLPMDEHTYQQAPYQEITEEEYNNWVQKMPKDVDFSGLQLYEYEDTTVGSQELACVGGVCEIVDIGTKG